MNDLSLERGSQNSADNSVEALVGQAAEEFIEQVNRGEKPDVEAYVRNYPAIAAVLRQVLASLQLIRVPVPVSVVEASAPVGAQVNGCLGDFRIFDEIGRGGMGIVYEAEQVSLGRRVALKVLPFAAAMDAKQLQRFKNEAQAAAHLHHQNIVPVYAVGCERGVHYYAMQFIEGQTLANLIRELRRQAGLEAVDSSASIGPGSALASELISGRWAPARAKGSEVPPHHGTSSPPHDLTPPAGTASTERSTKSPAFFRTIAHLGVQAAEALEHAHAKGIIHRDIKPANILVDIEGNLWITDFGLARMLSEAGLTMTGDLLGTLRYMSPEQALAKRVPVDHRTDIYSLGVTLYELLTLRPAYDGRDRQEVLQQIAFEEPRLPRRHNKAIPAELQTIIRKAMGKSPAERYATAQEMADDLRRFLDDKPIRAKRPTILDWTRKWARRHQGIVITGIAGLIVAVGILAVCMWLILGAYRAEATHRQVAVKEADVSRRLLYASDMNLAQQAWEAGDTARARSLLERQWPQDGREDLRGFEWRYLWALCRDGSRETLRGHTGRVSAVALSPDGQILASCSFEDHSVRLWDVASQRHVKLQMGWVESIAFAPDGQTLAIVEALSKGVRLWDVAARCERAPLLHSTAINAVAFSSAYLLAAGCQDGTIRIWDVARRREVGSPFEAHSGFVSQVAFSPDGSTVASGGADGRVCLWDVAAHRLIATLQGHTAWVNSLSFSPDGKLLASASNDTTVRLWDMVTKQQVKKLWSQRTALTLVACYSSLRSLAFSRDSKVLATGGGDGTIRLWDIETKEVMALLRGHTAAITAVAFASDGRSLVSGSEDGTVKVWDVAPGPDPNTLTGHKSNLSSLAFSPDGKTLAVADSLDQTVKLWDLASRTVAVLEGHKAHLWRLAFAPNGQTVASTSQDGTVRLWDVTSKKQLGELQLDSGKPGAAAFSPDGTLLAVGCWWSFSVRVWDVASRRQVAELTPGYGYRVQFTPDGTLLAAGSDKTVQLWDVATWQNAGAFSGHTAEVLSFAFAPDGRTLAVGAADGTLCLWDVAQKRQVARRKGHTSNVESLAFSPDGRRLATSGADATVKLWDVALLQEVATLTGHDGPVNSLAFAPDGNTLATASADATVRLWQAPPLAVALREPAAAPSKPPVETFRLFGLEQFGNAQVALVSEGNVHRVEVTAVDGTDWHAKIQQVFDDFQDGATYTVRFRAKAAAPRPMFLYGHIQEPDWHGIGLAQVVPLTEDWQPYQYEFQARDLAARNAIEFQVGQQTGTVWIADFTLTRRDK